MTDKLTFGLVAMTERSGVEATNLLKQVDGEYVTGYRCPECGGLYTEDNAQYGYYAYKCDECGATTETSIYESAPECDSCFDCQHNCSEDNRCDDGCEHDCSDDECPGLEMERLNERDGFAADLICPSCYAQPLEEIDNELFRCSGCDEIVEASEAEQHLYDHLEEAWT